MIQSTLPKCKACTKGGLSTPTQIESFPGEAEGSGVRVSSYGESSEDLSTRRLKASSRGGGIGQGTEALGNTVDFAYLQSLISYAWHNTSLMNWDLSRVRLIFLGPGGMYRAFGMLLRVRSAGLDRLLVLAVVFAVLLVLLVLLVVVVVGWLYCHIFVPSYMHADAR